VLSKQYKIKIVKSLFRYVKWYSKCLVEVVPQQRKVDLRQVVLHNQNLFIVEVDVL
jgi:hypothetical protein